jgi:two-component system cell cycle sensor histidine kinase/response regulator CckA
MTSRPTILLVEDEAHLRAAVGRVLTGAGYTVIAASGGEAALELYESAKEIALLVTDVRLPDMYGRRLAHRLLEERPTRRLPVLYVSGHPAEIAMDTPLSESERFLQKPFEFPDLLALVRELLATLPTSE